MTTTMFIMVMTAGSRGMSPHVIAMMLIMIVTMVVTATMMMKKRRHMFIWVVVKIRVPLWVRNIIRHFYLGYPKRDPNFDNHPYVAVGDAALVTLVSEPPDQQGFLRAVRLL